MAQALPDDRLWALIETGSNQDFIFQSNRQHFHVGASEILHRVGTWVNEAVLAVPHAAIDRVVVTSSKAMLLVRDPEVGRAIVEQVTRRALIEAPGLELWGYVETPQPDHADPMTRVEDVHAAHAAVRWERSSAKLRFLAYPFSDLCARTGLPAAGRCQRPGAESGDEESLSPVGVAVRQASEGPTRQLLAGLVEKEAALADRREEVDNAGWVAVVHIDGNGVGDVIRGIDAIEVYRGFSTGLKEATRDAFTSACAIPETEGHTEWLLPLIVGGDDVTFVCDARVAIPVVRAYLKAFEQKTVGLPGLGDGEYLTAAAGIAVVKPHYPFHAAYHLAEQLAHNAKQAKRPEWVKAVGRRSAYDFHVLHDSVASPLSELRRGFQLTDRVTSATAPATLWPPLFLAPPGLPSGRPARPPCRPVEGRRPRWTHPDPPALQRTPPRAPPGVLGGPPPGRRRTRGQLQQGPPDHGPRRHLQGRRRRPAPAQERRAHPRSFAVSTFSGVVIIAFTSDWRCGTGKGTHGGVDLMVTRDQQGLPYVPAETVKGLWREACERAAWGLSDGIGKGPWHDLVRHLFGSTDTGDPATARGRISIRPARLTDDWLNAVADPSEGPVLRSALVITRYGVKIAESGVAEDDTLRLMERARAGLTVTAPFSVESWQPEWAVALLLQAGARLWHHAGGSRRRGAGGCSVSLTGMPELPALIAAHQTDVPGFALLPAQPATPASSSDLDAETKEATRRAIVTVTTLLPVLSTRSVEGNVARGLPFVPGSSLLPLVARAIGGRAPSLIRDGRLCVTDAVPAPLLPGPDDLPVPVRMSPLPRTLLSPDKGRAWEVGELLVDALKGVPAGCKSVSGWGAVVDGQWRVFQPRLAVTAHNSIDDDAQRPLDNGLYTYEVIPAGQTLRAEILCDGLTDAEWAVVLELRGERTLGRYSSTGYGLVELAVADYTRAGAASATEDDEADESPLTRFAVHLASDVLLVDDRGRLAPRADELARQLGNRLAVALRVRASFVSLSRRESWTTTRTLPRPSMVGLAAGSVVEFDVTGGPLTAAALDAVLAQGIGTRRAEGFGRLQRLDSPPLTMVAAEPAEATSSSQHDPNLPKPTQFARLRRVSWEAEILRRIPVLAADAGFRQTYVKDGFSGSQLGALREAAIRLPRDRESVQRWVTATEQHDTKSDAWTKERLEAIRAVGTRGKGMWGKRLAGVLNNDETAQPIPSDLGGVPPEVVSAVLLAEVLRLAAREGGEDR